MMSSKTNCAGVGLLSDTEIVQLIQEGCITGLPPTTSDYYSSDSPVQAASVDLHVGGIFLPRAAADEAGGENHPLNERLLNTGETVLVQTAETLQLPTRIGGLAFPPSQFAVKGLLVTNAGHVDPEYSGPLRFTIINMGHQVQKLESGGKVSTLVLFGTSREPKKGWLVRTGKPGRSPNTEDLCYLSPDFAEVGNRAQNIAKIEIEKAQLQIREIEQRWTRRMTYAGILFSVIVVLVIGIFTWYSPVSRLDTKVDLMREEFTKTNNIEERLKKLESEDNDVAELPKKMGSLESRIGLLEKRGK